MVDLSFFHIENPSAERAGLGNDYTVGVGVAQFDRCCDGIGTVLYVDECVFRHTSHAWINC